MLAIVHLTLAQFRLWFASDRASPVRQVFPTEPIKASALQSQASQSSNLSYRITVDGFSAGGNVMTLEMYFAG